MLQLVRWMLQCHDRHPRLTPTLFVVLSNAAAVISILTGHALLSQFGIGQDLAIFLLMPWVIYLTPLYWAAAALLLEQLWMMIGLYRLLSFENNSLKKRISQMVRYTGQA